RVSRACRKGPVTRVCLCAKARDDSGRGFASSERQRGCNENYSDALWIDRRCYLRDLLSANEPPPTPHHFVFGLCLVETQSEYAWCYEIYCGQDSHATFGDFRNRNQTIFRGRCRLSQDLSYVLNGGTRLAAEIQRKRDDVEISTEHAPNV